MLAFLDNNACFIDNSACFIDNDACFIDKTFSNQSGYMIYFKIWQNRRRKSKNASWNYKTLTSHQFFRKKNILKSLKPNRKLKCEAMINATLLLAPGLAKPIFSLYNYDRMNLKQGSECIEILSHNPIFKIFYFQSTIQTHFWACCIISMEQIHFACTNPPE